MPHTLCVCIVLLLWAGSTRSYYRWRNDSVPPALSTVSNNRIWWRMDAAWMLHSLNCTLQEKFYAKKKKKYQEEKSSGLQYIVLTLGHAHIRSSVAQWRFSGATPKAAGDVLHLFMLFFLLCHNLSGLDFKWQQYVHSYIYQHTSKIKSERYYRKICLDTTRCINNKKKKSFKVFFK